MDFTGMMLGYKRNRALTIEEQEGQLKQKIRLEFEPNYDLSVVKVNGTFLEMVDRHYAWRGFWTLFTLVNLLMFGGGYMSFVAITLDRWGNPNQNEDLLFLLFFALMWFPLIGILIWIMLKETFTNTHFPIRLNRKNRKIYVFRPGRPNKPILEAEWDKLFINLAFCGQGGRSSRQWDIRAHVMADDGVTVLDTFAFDMFVPKGDLDLLRGHWEFIRRYMEDEDGAQKASELVGVCMPIANKRESPRFSLNRMWLNFAAPGEYFWYLVLPVIFLLAVGRWISMQTSRVPVWPQAIEDECRIEPDDPFVRDESTNPTERFWAL